MSADHKRISMALFRTSHSLPRRTPFLLSPWLLVGSALILGLAIAFLAVKNARQERENMARNLLERAGGLMWAMEGGARASMGMRNASSYLQFMLEETARQQDIVYLAVITAQGEIVAHSNPQLVGTRLYPAEAMEGIGPYTRINWRIIRARKGERIFEASRLFAPVPGFREHMGHSGPDHARPGHAGPGHGFGMGRMMRGMDRGGPPSPPREFPQAPPGIAPPPPPPPPPGSATEIGPGGLPAANPPIAPRDTDAPYPESLGGESVLFPGNGNELTIVVGLDMASFESALVAAERSTLFTALLVGLLGVGGFISLYWAQTYKMSRRMLLDTRAFADEVINSLPLGLLILNADGVVTQVNAVAEKLLGCGSDVLRGKRPGDLRGADWEEIAARVRQGEAVLEEEHDLPLPAVAKPGADSPALSLSASVSASAISNEEGENLGMIYLLRDLREVKRLQAELRRSERLSTLGNMAARVAHEIRNPLSSIKGFATYLGTRHDNDADREAARTMIGEVDRLNRVVSELLDFSRPSNLDIAPTELTGVLERTLRLAEMDAATRDVNLQLCKQDAGAAPVLVAVDAERITQALLNLALNAIQATDPGGTVSLAVRGRENGRAALTVTDTGRGMAPEMLAQAFSPYFTTRTTGTGLGLSIVAKIVEDHGGEIRMDSAPGQGTTVTLWLPLAGNGEPEPAGESNV